MTQYEVGDREQHPHYDERDRELKAYTAEEFKSHLPDEVIVVEVWGRTFYVLMQEGSKSAFLVYEDLEDYPHPHMLTGKMDVNFYVWLGEIAKDNPEVYSRPADSVTLCSWRTVYED